MFWPPRTHCRSNRESESRLTESMHGQWRSQLHLLDLRTQAEHREPRTLASRF
jgi:hypothetical protein